MNTRRAHSKSRHGCLTCKRRRVKCDEVRPVCGHCRQRRRSCDYNTQAPYLWAADKLNQRQDGLIISTASAAPDLHSHTDSSIKLLDRFSFGKAAYRPAPTLHMRQLELIVQWQNHTYKYFARARKTEYIWQNLIIEEALRNPMLMHGILGVSALDLALSRGPSEMLFWADLATAHNDEALRSLIEKLFDINPANAKAMLGLSSSVVAYAFGIAVTNTSDSDKPSLDALLNVFFLCRGVIDIINTARSDLKHGDFSPLFMRSLAETSSDATIPTNVKQSLDNLELMNNSLKAEHGHDYETYVKSIHVLRDLSTQTFSQHVCMSLAAEFAIRSPKPILGYLQNRHPFSLIILAHYCAFLHMVHGNSFIQPWGSSVLRDVCASLDGRWKSHIKWPISQVFGETNVI